MDTVWPQLGKGRLDDFSTDARGTSCHANDMPDLEHYKGGREQGYIKHALIEKYLERFTIKIGSKWDEIAFIDAFAGPWGAKSEDLSDTSFGIALDRLERGLKVLQTVHGKSPRIRAFLIEKDLDAFGKLDAFVQGAAEDLVGSGGRHTECEFACDPVGDSAEVLKAAVSAGPPLGQLEESVDRFECR